MSKQSKSSYKGNKGSSNKPNSNRSYGNKKDRAPENRVLPKGGEESAVSSNQGYDSIRSNDIAWWNQSPMYTDAVRVPFNRIMGDPIVDERITVDTVPTTPITLGPLNASMPGIMRIGFVPTIGSTANGSNSPVNRAFTSLFGNIYSKTTGTPPIQQADLAMFMTALTSIAYMIAAVKRILGVAQLYNGQNYYYPKALLKALGVNPDDVIGKQDLIRMKLNDAILSFNNLKVPDFMSVYKRQYGMVHNVYADEDSTVAQLFVFVPDGYYRYMDTESTLAWNPWPTTIGDLQLAIEDCLCAWRNSSDLGLISGSIQRAFSESNLITLDYVTSADVILPVVDRNITWQINNSTALPLDATSLDITQDVVGNCLVFNPKWDPTMTKIGLAMLSRENQLLNSYDGETGDEFIMEATRLVQYPIDNTDATHSVPFPNTELVTSYDIYYTYKPGSGLPIETTNIGKFTNLFYDDGMPLEPMQLVRLGLLSKFKNGPRMYVTLLVPETDEIRDCGFIGDVYRYTTINREALRGLNEAALQSVYATNVV